MPNEVPLIIFFTVVIPILVTAAVIVTYFFFRSRERQSLINKGIPPEQMADIFRRSTKSNPYFLLKIGIVVAFFGLGLGLGMMLDDLFSAEKYAVFVTFLFIGLGFITASLVSKKLEEKDELKKNHN
ncbi:MAG: hypothetical protein JW995_10270 [Melioribacteraceae bacterium]|nr:hypothetical protein [Melioribacteraceae bacterium]